ncbi:MAG TPA: thiamine pyrophosphate-dependent enzyme [Acetobacteraceae bacterium]|jgi:thiamine pyrophosphate-dependent acetolactate synthase large subunit-like protein|nr:thiamine pyrophosphate-dependent enzyme [Acetobacteraceae bacterium]
MRNDGTLNRREVTSVLLRDPGDLLVVSGLGAPSYDAAAAGDRTLNFYLWGAMGGAAMIGLGIALAQPSRRVLVLTGDGEMLMGLGSLATIAAAGVQNLAVAVLDNARYGETGSQPSHTGLTTDLAAVAAACGWANTATARSMDEAETLRLRLRREHLFAVLRIAPDEPPRHLPPRDGAYLSGRFRRAIGVAAD